MYLHLMPFFRQAIPNHLRQFFGCYLGFLHELGSSVPDKLLGKRQSFYKLHCYYFVMPFSGAFCGRTGVFPSAGEFCSKVWRVGHTA